MEQGIKAILGIDIDGTVMDFVFPDLTDPKPYFKEFCMWASKYFHLHFFSTRFNPEVHGWSEAKREIQKLRNWFTVYGIPYDHITPYKPPAICIIDDRAFGFDISRMPREIDWLKIKEKMQTLFREYVMAIDREG